MPPLLMVETSDLVAILLKVPGWKSRAEQIVASSAFTTWQGRGRGEPLL